jgi:Mg2+ and Co2+ transporter CorA
MRRLEAVIEDIGVEHELASDLRESLQSLIRLVAFARAHEAGEGLRRRLKVIDADLRTAAEHTAYLAADMEFMLDATVGLIGIQQNKVIYLLSIVSIADPARARRQRQWDEFRAYAGAGRLLPAAAAPATCTTGRLNMP